MQKNNPNEMISQSSLCPNCRFPVTAEDTFCGECGFDLTQETTETSVQAPTGEGPEGAESGALQARVGRFAAPRSLRRSYFDLGLALKAQARYREAAEAFGQAEQAEGNSPKDVDIFLQQAFVFEQGTNPERAFRTYLEAVRKDPDEADIVLPHIHRMVTPKIVLENGVWLVSEWGQTVEKNRVSPPDRVQIAAFLGRIHLYLGQYDEALAAFQRALQADPQSAPAVVAQMLAPAYLPPEFDLQANRGQAQFALARIWQVLGNFDEALRIVELALSQNLGEGNYPEAPVQLLKAELLAGRGQNSAAAEWYYEAGQRYSWRGDSKTAARLLEQAVSLKKNYPEACWAWMEAERMLAYDVQPPFVNRRALERSLNAWRIGLYSGWPDKTYFWAYTTRGLLCELEARHDPSRRIEYWWDAIRWLELALVFEPGDVFSWAYLIRFFRYLNLEANGEVVTRRTIELDEDNFAALEERAALLASRGQFEEAWRVITRRRELEAYIWADAVSAYILIGQGNAAAAQARYAGKTPPDSPPWLSKYEEALRQVDRLIAAEPEDNWYLEMRVMCLRSIPSRAAESKMEIERLYQACLDPQLADSKDVRFTRGWMAFLTGRVNEAMSLYESFLDDPVLANNARRNLGICRLASGQWPEGEQDLLLGLAGALNPRECDDTINDLHEVGNLPVSMYNRLRKKIAARRAEVQRFPTALDELRTALQAVPAGKPAQTAHIASAAVQARLALEANDYALAFGAYQKLALNDFPAKEQAMDQTMDTWQKAIDALLKDGRFTDASQELLEMESMISATDPPQRLAELDARLALAAFSRDQHDEGHDYFVRALSRGNEAQWVAAGEQIGDTWRGLLADPAQLWRLDGHLHKMEPDPESGTEAASARRSMRSFLDGYFQLDREITASDEPYCLPVVLWVGSELLKLVDPAVSPAFINEMIPGVRQRIQNALGIAFPFVRVRDDLEMTTSYQIDLYEQPTARGEVFLEMSFCGASPADLDKLRVPKKNYLQAYDPYTGGSGCWVSSKYYPAVIASNWTLASPSEYMLAHLESVLRRHLADYVSIAEVERLLENLDERWNDLMERSLPNMAARLGFARLLRALVREQVPVNLLQAVLQVGANGGLDEPARFGEMLRAARRQLRGQLPGIQSENMVEVPPEWGERMEGWWVERGGLQYFEPPAKMVAALLDAVQEWTAAYPRPGAIVVRSPFLRPHIQRLTVERFPDWPVLSYEEMRGAQMKS